MNLLNQFEQGLTTHDFPMEHIPVIDLYMDQILCLFDDDFPYNKSEPRLTRAMINNYVKQKIIPAPVKKKYNQTHIYCLIIICLLKRILSMQEIKTLLDPYLEDSKSLEDTYRSYLEQKQTLNELLQKGDMTQFEQQFTLSHNSLLASLLLSYYCNVLSESARSLASID